MPYAAGSRCKQAETEYYPGTTDNILSDTKLKSYIGQKIRLPMQDAVIIFVHRFSAVDTVNFRVRDFDNYDVQDILNCLVYEGYLKSDSGSCLDGMDITKTGAAALEQSAYLIPKSRLCEVGSGSLQLKKQDTADDRPRFVDVKKEHTTCNMWQKLKFSRELFFTYL